MDFVHACISLVPLRESCSGIQEVKNYKIMFVEKFCPQIIADKDSF
jgi:hypothetical protein